MKVSIITPSFNQAGFLRETVESVLSQDYPDIEYIIMDGGSTDGSVDILKEYSNRIAHWESGPDSGQADAINRGLKRASGGIVAYLNSDDTLAPGAVSAIVNGFRSNPGAGVIYGATEKIDARGRVVKPRFLTPYSRSLLRTLCLVPQPSSFYSREAWETCGPFDTSLHYVMDWDFLMRAADRGFLFVAIEDMISRFRVYETTKSSAGGWKRLEEIARVGRRHNGPLDYNWLIYVALRTAHHVEAAVGATPRRPLRRMVSKVAGTLKKPNHFMLHDNAP